MMHEFEIAGDAGKWGQFRVQAGWFVVRFLQKIRRAGEERMFESMAVYCGEERDGALVIRVILFNPDWGAPLQIARMVSRPNDPAEYLTPVGFNLDHVSLDALEF
jgi:hypothetical protein